MVVELSDQIRIYVTGSSRPCLSLFKAHDFKVNGIIFEENDPKEEDYWRRMERFQRSLLGKKIPDEYYQEKEELEKRIMNVQIDEVLKLEEEFVNKWKEYPFRDARCALGFRSYWDKKDIAFEKGIR